MKKIFIDTNILLDVILNRKEFVDASEMVYLSCESKMYKGFISAITLSNIYYIAGKIIGKNDALYTVKDLLQIYEVVPLEKKILGNAANSELNDFEDAIQFYSALQIKANHIITRNPKHFPDAPISILTPREFLAYRNLN